MAKLYRQMRTLPTKIHREHYNYRKAEYFASTRQFDLIKKQGV